MIKMIIADDHQIVAEGISRLLPPDVECCAIAKTLADAETQLAEHKPDVLLLDVAFPDGDGIDAIPTLSEACPKTRILMLTMYAEGAVVQRAMTGGAHGFVLKSADMAELLTAINTVVSGSTYICNEARMLMVMQQEDYPVLTKRERDILRLLVAGRSMKEVANDLCLGFETVHTYTKYLRQKLGVNNTPSLVRIALAQHLA